MKKVMSSIICILFSNSVFAVSKVYLDCGTPDPSGYALYAKAVTSDDGNNTTVSVVEIVPSGTGNSYPSASNEIPTIRVYGNPDKMIKSEVDGGYQVYTLENNDDIAKELVLPSNWAIKASSYQQPAKVTATWQKVYGPDSSNPGMNESQDLSCSVVSQ